MSLAHFGNCLLRSSGFLVYVRWHLVLFIFRCSQRVVQIVQHTLFSCVYFRFSHVLSSDGYISHQTFACTHVVGVSIIFLNRHIVICDTYPNNNLEYSPGFHLLFAKGLTVADFSRISAPCDVEIF